MLGQIAFTLRLARFDKFLKLRIFILLIGSHRESSYKWRLYESWKMFHSRWRCIEWSYEFFTNPYGLVGTAPLRYSSNFGGSFPLLHSGHCISDQNRRTRSGYALFFRDHIRRTWPSYA